MHAETDKVVTFGVRRCVKTLVFITALALGLLLSSSSVRGDDGRLEPPPPPGAADAGTEERGTSCLNNQRPVANAGNDREVSVGDTVVFDGAGSFDPDGRELIRYYWTFGNGLTRTAIVASTVYDRPGTFTVTLTVTDACRSRTTDSITVTVLDNGADPCADNRPPVANAGADKAATIGQLLAFSGAGSTDPENSIASYEWNFGDGSSATGRNPTHSYSASGDYTVTLTVTDDCGDSSTDSSFADVQGPCDGNRAPTVNAGESPRTVDVGALVTFDGRGSRDPEGGALTYTWEFGNGQVANTAVVTHTFLTEGTFLVRLTVRDACGAAAQGSVFVSARRPAEPEPDELTADFTVNPVGPRVQQSVTFTAAAAPQADGLWFYWNFGDGVAGYGGPVVTRSFATPGVFNVTLTVTVDGTWESATRSKQVTIDAGLSLVGVLPGIIVFDSGLAIVNGYAWAGGAPGKLVTADVRGNSNPTMLKAQTLYGSMYDLANSPTLVAVAAGYGGVYLFNAADPVNQALAGQHNTFDQDGFEAFGVAFKGATLYVSGAWSGLRVLDTTNPASPRLVRSLSGIGSAKQMAIDGSRLYVADASLPGVRVFDITQPTNPVAIGSTRTFAAPGRIAVQDSLLAVCEAGRGLEFIDVSNIASPRSLSRILDGGAVFGVGLSGNSAYATYSSAAIELDIADRTNPKIVSVVSLGYQGGTVRNVGGRVYTGLGRGIVAVLEP